MTLLVDCGATSLVAMRQQGLDPAEVDAVVVSHLHGDHFGGIPFLILHCQFAGRVRPLTIVGPAGVRERVIAAMEVRDGPRRRRGPCQWSPVAGASGRTRRQDAATPSGATPWRTFPGTRMCSSARPTRSPNGSATTMSADMLEHASQLEVTAAHDGLEPVG
jgi:ribonuclease BN (tRNA processing enzyme)